jgi:hypothetical protein
MVGAFRELEQLLLEVRAKALEGFLVRIGHDPIPKTPLESPINFTFKDGKIVEAREFFDTAKAIAAHAPQ